MSWGNKHGKNNQLQGWHDQNLQDMHAPIQTGINIVYEEFKEYTVNTGNLIKTISILLASYMASYT